MGGLGRRDGVRGVSEGVPCCPIGGQFVEGEARSVIDRQEEGWW